MVDLNDFTSEKRCEFKGRVYSVRDNGSVYRHHKEGTRLARLDNKWTFGKKNEKTGYMMIAGVRVHQIVATAFHGIPEDPKMVVDHIDTNRCNNRPENLRWLTRLENTLNNPYTRSRIIFHCGSIEAFLDNPSILRQTASEPNTSWMRTVSKEEAARCRMHLDRWKQEDNQITKSKTERKEIGEWIYNDYTNEEETELVDSLTPLAKQLYWKTPSEFPLCPSVISESPLQDYISNILSNKTFCRNKIYNSKVIKAELSLDKSHIAVLTTTSGATDYALTEIRCENGFFIHESIRTFFTEEGAEKYYTLSLGEEWTGGDVLEDFC